MTLQVRKLVQVLAACICTSHIDMRETLKTYETGCNISWCFWRGPSHVTKSLNLAVASFCCARSNLCPLLQLLSKQRGSWRRGHVLQCSCYLGKVLRRLVGSQPSPGSASSLPPGPGSQTGFSGWCGCKINRLRFKRLPNTHRRTHTHTLWLTEITAPFFCN